MLVVEGSQQLTFDGRGGREGGINAGQTPPRDLNYVPAPVDRRPPAQDEALCLQVVEQTDELAWVDADCVKREPAGSPAPDGARRGPAHRKHH